MLYTICMFRELMHTYTLILLNYQLPIVICAKAETVSHLAKGKKTLLIWQNAFTAISSSGEPVNHCCLPPVEMFSQP